MLLSQRGGVMAKLVLLADEVRLIKGLVQHAKLNNQQITAIFSHLDRNINHREIGYVRANRSKYAAVPVASAKEVGALLARYRRLQSLARRIGVNPSTENQTRVEKAVELMKAAATIYNTCTLGFRTEIFITNAVIAWTYALHAYYIDQGHKPVYTKNGVPVLTPEEDEKLWDLSECLKSKHCPLSKGEANNLRYLLALRHEIEHRLAREIDESVQPKVQACALNFSEFCEKHFGDEYSLKYELDFAIQFVKLTVGATNLESAKATIPNAVQAVNKLMEENMSEADFNDPKYAYRVYVVPKTTNNAKNADQAVTYAPEGSAIEMAIKHVERPKFRATEIVEKVRAAGFPAFNKHAFQSIWKPQGLKDPAKNLAIQLGGQWFWYAEIVPLVCNALGGGDVEQAKAA